MPWYKKAAPIRALENRVFIVTSNRTGFEKRGGYYLEFVGGSVIVAPDGKILVETNQGDEGVFYVDIIPELAEEKRINANNDILADRRKDFYELSGGN